MENGGAEPSQPPKHRLGRFKKLKKQAPFLSMDRAGRAGQVESGNREPGSVRKFRKCGL